MRRIGLTLLSILTLITLLAIQPPSQPAQAAPNPPPKSLDVDPALEGAFNEKINQSSNSVLAYVIFDIQVASVDYSSTGDLALLWLSMADAQTGEILPVEPGLAIANKVNGLWQVTLQSDANWLDVLNEVPADLLSDNERARYLPGEESKDIQAAPFRGYKLPWAAGATKRLSGSIGHFLIYFSCSETSCRYAYDFADGTMFPLLASKGGTVKYVRWDIPTRSGSACGSDGTTGNYIVLEDKSTTPTTYQLYLHLAQNSIPQNLRTVGTPVNQGDYIGIADNNGASCGHHLHFHVHTNPYSYWGSSVDIAFDEVPFNDGEPRTCNEATKFPGYGTGCQDSYTSSNIGAHPPTGGLSLPANGSMVTGPNLLVAGTASDDLGVTKIQVIARGMDGIWQDVGTPLTSTPFNASVDLCSAPVPDGPVDIALRIWDLEGNMAPGTPGLRTVVKNYSCAPPPPPCTLTADKIILYADSNYQGACREYARDAGGGEYPVPNQGADEFVGDDNTASIRVGTNVRAVLFTDTSYGGRSEALEVSDPNLADNRIGADTISSLKVQPKGVYFPGSSAFKFPTNESILLGTDSISTAITGAAATKFDIRLYSVAGGMESQLKAYLGLSQPVLSLGSLAPGRYKLTGEALNNTTGYVATPVYFTVDGTQLSGSSIKSVPYVDNMEVDNGDWQATGQWNRAVLNSDRGYGWRFNGYTNPNRPINYGSLTSPPVTLPAEGASYLHFDYRVDTESPYPYWDQRRVQISVDGGQFQDIQWVENGGAPRPDQKAPLWDEGQKYWLLGSPYNLSAYAGKTIRVRYYFFTGDDLYNTGGGWEIDNVRIDTDAGDTSCAESTRNDSLATATQVSLGQTVNGVFVCPSGDVDFYKFSGSSGQKVAFAVDVSTIGSTLDSYLFLLDSTGGLIAENDDIDPGVVRDSALGLTLPYTGNYYLKVKAWDHPAAGGPNYPYTLRLQTDSTPPFVSFGYPISPWIPGAAFDVTALASDAGSGIGLVDFYWHNPDWLNGAWELLGSDSDGSDGWSLPYDLSAKGNLINSGIYVEAHDRADNRWGAMLIGLQFDTEKPVSQLNPLTAEIRSTAIPLTWSAFDSGSGLAALSFQVSPNGVDWQDWLPNRILTTPRSWFIGQFGQTYEFRMRAQDMAGNQEDYPAGPEAITRIESACQADLYEQNGQDNTPAGAVPLASKSYQEHNLCGLNDEDWVSFPAQAGVELLISSGSISGGAAVKLEVFNSSGEQLASAQAPDLGAGAGMTWIPPESGTYYLRVTPLVEGLAGTDARYSLWCGPPLHIYLPVIGK